MGMKPPIFDYYDPRTEEEALALLSEFGPDAKLLAGGQSLMPLLNMRLLEPSNLIDLNHLTNLRYITVSSETLGLGALTTQRQAEHSNQLTRHCPLIQEALRQVGYPQIRNRGTIGGSLSHADPSAELPAVMAALEAQFEINSQRGSRVVDWQDFFVSYLTTALEADELLTEIRLPLPLPRTGCSFMEIQRVAGAFAIVGVAVSITLDEAHRCQQVRLAFSGVSPVPQRALASEAALQHDILNASRLQEAAQLAATELEPENDIHGSAAYRKNLACVLAQRALSVAFERAVVSSGQ
jgi:CO/xanthine dehydrogenase FAD-binding subunit